MKIVIIGDGKVGYKLARQLSADDYDIVMIDSNERKLRFAIRQLIFSASTETGWMPTCKKRRMCRMQIW